jgi:hypothetical protein
MSRDMEIEFGVEWEKGMEERLDRWFSEGWGLVGLRCLIVLLACFVIGSLLLRVIDALGYGRRRLAMNDEGICWMSRTQSKGKTHVRFDPGSFEYAGAKRKPERAGQIRDVRNGVVGASDVGDTCVLM